jgi:redox-sensitive bicupin YhaK (pirin superfamily)
MRWEPSQEPVVGAPPAVETLIVPRTRDLGGFEVRRALPSVERRLVGPFIFFDQMGPAVSSSRERMEQAKEDWREGRFPPVPGETEFIPLPEEEAPAPVRYP